MKTKLSTRIKLKIAAAKRHIAKTETNSSFDYFATEYTQGKIAGLESVLEMIKKS